MNSSTITFLLLILFILLILGAAIWLYVYWWLMQRPNPKLHGRLSVPCLDAPVDVRRDKHGVPHVSAQSEADLFRAQGFLHAQDRMWQLEQNRRTASGRLAEVFGAPALEADRFCRVVGFRRAAAAELLTLDPATRQILDWYAAGVNAYIQTHPGRLAAELNLLRVPVDEWTAVDTLAFAKVLGWAMSLNWESELTRLQLLQELDPYIAAELEPDYPEKSPLVLEGVGGETKTRLLHTAGLLLNQYEAVREWLGAGEGQGSNSWVLAPKHSLNRRPLLAADPHLNVQLPGLIYEMHLAAPGFEVSGATFPGTPGVLMGHNARIAWGMTNALVDTQDLFIERPHPQDPTRFAYGDGWEQAQVIEETIQVRRGAPHVEKVIVTRHGPIVTGLLRVQESTRARSATSPDRAACAPMERPRPWRTVARLAGPQPGQRLGGVQHCVG